MKSYWNTDNFPVLVGRSCHCWNLWSSPDGRFLATIPAPGEESRRPSSAGTPFHLAKLIRDYPNWPWELTPFGLGLLEQFRWIAMELQGIKIIENHSENKEIQNAS